MEFWRGGAWGEVPVGSALFLPCGLAHTFRKVGDGPLRLIVHTAPAGFEVLFERVAEVFQRPGERDMPRIIEIAAEHGIEFLSAG